MPDDELEPLITECPSCETRFRVSETQLQRARGRVRCGACLNVFHGIEHLVLDSLPEDVDEHQAREALDALLDELAGSPAADKVGAADKEGAAASNAPVLPGAGAPLAECTFQAADHAAGDGVPFRPAHQPHVAEDSAAARGNAPRGTVNAHESPQRDTDAPQSRGSTRSSIRGETVGDTGASSAAGSNESPQRDTDAPQSRGSTRSSIRGGTVGDTGASSAAGSNESPQRDTDAPQSRGSTRSSIRGETVGDTGASSAAGIPGSDLRRARLATTDVRSRANLQGGDRDREVAPTEGVAPAEGVAHGRADRDREVAPTKTVAAAAGAASPVTFGEHRPRRPFVYAGIAVGLLLLVAQVLWYQFDDWAREPAWRPLYGALCGVVGCELPVQRDTALLDTRNLVVRSHASRPGTLLVNAVIVNRADFAQPFPVLELQFTTVQGNLVAARRFEPREYLAGDASGLKLMPARTPVQIELTMDDPGARAVNYRLSFR